MDTFKIKIRENCFRVNDPSYFDEVKSSGFRGGQQHKTDRTNNAYRKAAENEGRYTPKYRISEVDFGKPEKALVLEFSAPKLLYGTNLRQVHESDFATVVDKLREFLESIKVKVFRSEIENAVVMLVAYAKNICVAELGSAQEIIRVIAPFNYRPRSEYRQVLLRQEEKTSELKYYNNTSHLDVYDKLAEVQSNPTTKEEQGITNYLKHGTGKEQFEDWVKETLRLELTLHKKTAVRQVLSRFYGDRVNFTFKEAFSDKVCEEVLRREVEEVFNHPLQKLVLLTILDREEFNKVINEHCSTLAQRREMRVALDIIYSRGLGAYRQDVLSKASQRTWFRKLKQLRRVSESIRFPQAVTRIDNATVLEFILAKFGIESKLHAVEQLSLFQHK